MQPWTGAGLAMLAALLGAPAQVLRVSGESASHQEPPHVSASPKAARIEALIAKAVQASLPVGWQTGKVSLQGDGAPFAGRSVRSPLHGAARVEARMLAPLSAGPKPLSVVVSDERGPVQAVRASVQLFRVGSQGQAVKRGNEVTVSVRSGNVFVQARCIAQSAAEVGESVTVLCDNATRTLHASVVSSKEVEVTL